MAKTRSPNFPFIPLEEAVQRAREVWAKENRHAAAVETLVEHWGYKASSSGGRQTVAALRQFGLLEGRGGSVKLTELAQSILFSPEGSPEWFGRIQESALNPSMHKEILAKYQGELPSDQNLTYYLVVDRGFTEGGAAELIKELKATLAYAKLGAVSPDSMSSNGGDKLEDDDEMTAETLLPPEVPEKPGERRAVQLPYSPTGWATLQASFPLTSDEWDQMLAVLTAMKPALTEHED